MTKLISLSDFVLWLNSMTTTELINEFPNTFHLLNAGDAQELTVTKMLTNDAILWRLVKDYNKFLLQPIKGSMFLFPEKIFAGFAMTLNFEKKPVLIKPNSECPTQVYAYLNKKPFSMNCPRSAKTIADLVELDIDLIKSPFRNH